MRPHVFVSSTFFDLRQVRDDLRQFIEGIGYQALLSEHPSFPVDPNEPSAENCKRQVEREADIFVLVVGTRYGSIDKRTLKSITNLEYLAARAKSIPIYVFLDKSIEPLLKLWRANPALDLSSQVDSPQLLPFVDTIRAADGDAVWTFWFERATDITEVLRAQLASLMVQGLEWRRRLRSSDAASRLARLRGRSLSLALEQPQGWEYYLLAQLVQDGVEDARSLRDEHREGLALELGEDVVDSVAWSRSRLAELLRVTASLKPLLDVCGSRAMGPPGITGSVDDLVFVGTAIGRVYATVLEWSRRVRTANLPEAFRPVQRVLARFTDEVIGEIEAYGPRSRRDIDAALAALAAKPGSTATLDMTLTLRLSPGLIDEFDRELAKAGEALGA